MSKIRTKVPVIVEVREQKASVITIEISNWTYNVGQNYTATVRDYVDNSGTTPYDPMMPGIGNIKTKSKSYPIENIDSLFIALNSTIDLSMNYTERMNKLLASALLYITQSELDSNGKTIYGLLPTDWELVP